MAPNGPKGSEPTITLTSPTGTGKHPKNPKARKKENATPEIIKEFCDAIIGMKGVCGACKDVGIGFDTYSDWMDANSENYLAEFAEAVKKAEKELREKGKNTAILSIFNAMPKQWQAGAWWLERNFKEYIAIEKRQVTGEGGEPIKLEVKEVKDKSKIYEWFNKKFANSPNKKG